MHLRSLRAVILVSALCSLTVVATFGGLMRNAPPIVDEWLPRFAEIALHAPVDYGPGPGRGRPRTAPSVPAARTAYGSPSISAGSVTGITLTRLGSYIFMPTCKLGAPNMASGQQATCNVYSYGLAYLPYPAPISGTGYKVGDMLIMSPIQGLNCPFYPRMVVKAVDASGEITAVGGYTAGICFSFPTGSTYHFSGGAGSDYTLPVGSVRWYVEFATVSGGSGYTTAPAVTFQTSQFATTSGTATIANTTQVPSTVPQGAGSAGTQGMFGAAVLWPINAIHIAMLPDGRILSYGSDLLGSQTGALVYDIWDPSLGTGLDAHLVLPNTTSTDIFCSNTSVSWDTGQVLITGGDLTVNGIRNYGNNKTTIFNPAANTVSAGIQMQYPRWYPTIVSLINGDKLVLGGYVTKPGTATAAAQVASTPEVYNLQRAGVV